jgi:tetratricopeptide (TPR) repeat protein
MVAIKNPRPKVAALAVIFALVVCGCRPAGPASLVQGDEALRRGDIGVAIEKLKRATALMPDEPRAWNLLGLAYHQGGEPHLALQAYRQALAKDRSNIVSVAHYNLGSLLLEQGNVVGAADELRSYTLITNSAPGLVRLGTAMGRLRQFDSAERAFAAALRLEPANYEALNGLGVVRAQRGQRDAMQHFNAALQSNPKYGPAMLNAAAIAYGNSATKPAALQRARDYLALHPRSQHADAAEQLVRRLESELTPVRANVPPPPVAQVQAQGQGQTTSPLRTNITIRTNVPAFPTVVQTPPPPRVDVPSNAPRSAAPVVRTNPAAAVRVAQPTPTATPSVATASNNLPLTVVNVAAPPDFKIATAQPLPEAAPAGRAASPTSSTIPPDARLATDPQPIEPEKKGFFTKLNPFRGKSKPLTNDGPRPVVMAPSAVAPAEPAVAPSSKPVFPRYSYKSPRLPLPGNRVEAARLMQRGLEAHRAGRTNEALSVYQMAINADPSSFDAHYNSALLAFQIGDLARSLPGWEWALAIEPDSLNARYNFALALKQAGYAHDAASELEKILEGKPADSRAHLSLANLYAQQLNERDKARKHYLRLLELDPRNPQASAIRFWLAANQ